MAPNDLLAEITALVGSAQEAAWIVEESEKLLSDDSAIAVTAREMAERRADGEPLQYVLGSWQFRTLELIVDERALIPRPETEQVVEAALTRWRESRVGAESFIAVDLGTGTGAIGLSLERELRDEVSIQEIVLVDRSHDALSLALENIVALGAQRVSVASGSWFEALTPSLKASVHLLVANPPYVALRDRGTLAQELFYEPQDALFAMDAQGIPGFRDVAYLLENVIPWMAHGGVVAIEMAEHQVGPACEFATDRGLAAVQPILDLAGKLRGIVGVVQ